MGKRVDANHPAAIEYLDSRDPTKPKPQPAAPGLDPRYEEAVAACTEAGRFSTTHIQKALSVGYNRAFSMNAVMKAAGLAPERQKNDPKPKPKPPEPEPAEPAEPVAALVPHVRGPAAAKAKKKAAAMQSVADRIEAGPELHEVPDDIEAFADMTLRELIQRFGTDQAFTDWLKATQTIEAINEKRLKNAVTRGELVSRDLVRVGVIEPLNAAHIRLLTDGSKTIAQRATAMHDAGRSLGEIEKFVAEQVTSFLRPVKDKVARALKNA